MDLPRSVTYELPSWLLNELDLSTPLRDDEAKMRLAITLARRNVEQGGGPFAALVLELETGAVVAPGVNLVVPQSSSLLHAEIVALMFAQARLKTFTLAGGSTRYELVTSSEPCVQCLGACHWAGLARLVCGAPVAAAEAAGFEEGPRSEDWQEQLAARGTPVTVGVLAAEAGSVLSEYAAQGRLRYNARARAVGD
jgi:tRNA(Arg) A34 adenosine deaminase TadA